MSEISKFSAYKKKLEGVCNEHDLVFRFRQDTYPITLTILPCGGVEEQMSLLAEEADKRISPDARLVFYYKDSELGYKIDKDFAISDTLFSKLKNLYKNLYFTWLQYFFRNLVENRTIDAGSMPVIDEDDANDPPELPPKAKALEEAAEAAEDSAEVDELDGDDAEEDGPQAFCDDMEALISQAASVVRQENKATVALLQRRLNVGYSLAARIMDELEARGVVGPYKGGEPRDVLPVDEPDDGTAE